MIICDCGEIIDGCTFKEYIKTSAGPSTRTIGHKKCGYIFNFIDEKISKRYSSKKELKSLAMIYADMKKLSPVAVEKFLIEVDRLKSYGNLSDKTILVTACHRIIEYRE